MTWTPPEVAQSMKFSVQDSGWVPPEVKKKQESVSLGGSESLASPSVATEDKAVSDGAQLSFSGQQQTKTPDFMGMMDGGYKDQPSGVMKSVSEGLSKAEKPLEDKYAAYVDKKRTELTGGLKLPNPMEAVDPNQYQQDLENYTRVLRENPMAEKEDNKITAIGMLINQTKDADRVIEDYSQQNVAEKVGSGIKKGFEDYGRGYFELFDRLKQNQAVKELSVKLEDLDKGKDVTLDEGDRLLAQSLVENGNKIKQLEAISPSAYNIGKMAGESLGFTGEFLLTGGLGAGLAKSITKGVATKVAEGAAVSAVKRIGVGLSAKMAQTGIQVAAMPTFYKGIAEDVSKGENFGESLFKNYYKTFAENFTERIFLKTPWDKATVGSVDKLFGRLGVNMHTEKGVVGILASTAEEAAEEKIGEIMTAPLDNNNFKEFWNNYWDVKKNGELLGSVALMTVPMGLVSYSAKKYDDVKLDRIGKLLPSGIRSELDVVLNDKKLTLKEQYDLVGKIVEDNAANKTLGDNLGESASNIIRYVQQKTKQNVVSAVEDRAKVPTIGTKEEITTEEQAKLDYLESNNVPIPDGTTMEQLNVLYDETKQKEEPKAPVVSEEQKNIDGKRQTALKDLGTFDRTGRVISDVGEIEVHPNADGGWTVSTSIPPNKERPWERVRNDGMSGNFETEAEAREFGAQVVESFRNKINKKFDSELEQPTTKKQEPVVVFGEQRMSQIEEELISEREKPQVDEVKVKSLQDEFNTLEKEAEKQEWESVFNVPVGKATEAIDNLIKKEKEKPNGFGSFIDKKDARESKEVIAKYSDTSKLSDADVITDFTDALRGNPTTWYADGLKLRESVIEANKRGINTDELIKKAIDLYGKDGYSEKEAKSVVSSMIEPILKGSTAEKAPIAELQQQKQPIVGEEQIEVTQTKKEEDEKGDKSGGEKTIQGRQENVLVEAKRKLEREVRKEENKARLGRIFDNAAKLTGARLDITSEEKKVIRRELARDVVDYVKTEFDLLGEALVEKVKSFVKDNSIPLEDISDQELNDVLKEQGYAEGIRSQDKGNAEAQEGVVKGAERKVSVGNDGKDQKTPRGENEVTIEQKISQHYKKLIDPKSGVSKETRDILLNKDGRYDVVTKAQLNKFADEVIGSVLIDGEGGLDVILADLKSNDSKLIPSDLNGANVVLSYKLAYQYERLGAFDKAADVDIWRKKFGTQIGQMLSAFDEMMEVPEQRIRRLRGEMKEDRDAKMERKGTTGKLISEEISDIEYELNKVSVEALEKENEELKKKIEEVLSKKKGAVKAGATILTKDRAKQLADKIRSFRIKQDRLMSADPLTAAYVITRNGTLSLVAEVVEQTGNVTEAINKGLSAVRKSDWYQKLTNAERSVYENKYRGFLKDEFGLSNTYQLESIDIKDVEQNILDIITEHWTKVKKQEKSLETKLIEAGLDAKSASDIAGTAKELVYEYVKENGLTNIKKLFKEKPTTKSQAKIRETASQRVLNMIREGATQSDGLIDALADFYGYGKIGFDLLDRAIKIANESSTLKAGIRKTILLEEFENIIYDLDHGTAKKVYDAINDLYNTSILSAPTTTSRAVKGMLLTGLAHGAVATIANPRAMVLGGFKYFARGTWNGLKMAPSAIKTGIGGLDVSDVPSNVSYIRSVVNKPLIQHLKEMYNTLPDKKGGKLAGKRLSKALELGTKITFHFPVKMYRSLLAIDAPLATGLTEMEAFIKAYNDSMATEKDLSTSARLNKINERLGRDSKTINQIRQEVSNEIVDMKAKGEKIPPKYETIRELELVELMRDIELVEVSKRLSKQALLMNKPEGIFTGGMYSLLRNITSVKPEAVEVKDKETGKVKIKYKVSPQAAAAALALKFIFPIIRVPANFLRTASGYTPIGLVRASMSTTGYLKGSDKATRIKSSDERIRQAVSGAVGTTIGFALASLLFDYDDEDKTLQLSEDSPLKVTFMGTGDNTKNKTISKNYKEISFSIRRPDWADSGSGKAIWDTTMGGDKDWSDPISYVDNPLGMILAPLGYVSDRMKYYKPKEDEDGNIKPIWDGNFDLFMSIAWNSMAFGTSQSYMQGANDLLKLIPQNSKEMPSSFRMDAYNFFNRPITALFKPNLYQFMEKQLNAAVGRPEKEYAGVLAGVARFIPTLEDEFNGERTDQFGYPVTREFMIPFIPDALTDIIEEWKDEKLRRGTNDWKLILSRDKIVLPRSWKTDETHYGKYSDEDRRQAQEQAKIEFRNYVNDNYDYLKDLDDESLQEELNSARQDGYSSAKDWLTSQPTVK